MTPRYTRRLTDKILIAFHHACDLADCEAARQLLGTLEMVVRRPPITHEDHLRDRRKLMTLLAAAHERLWHIRQRDLGTDD